MAAAGPCEFLEADEGQTLEAELDCAVSSAVFSGCWVGPMAGDTLAYTSKSMGFGAAQS